MSSPSRWPHLFPPRIYELTFQMLEQAVHAEQADLLIIQLTENADTCHLIVDQCIALADCILDRRTEAPWPPSEKVIRVFANLTVHGLENPPVRKSPTPARPPLPATPSTRTSPA